MSTYISSRIPTRFDCDQEWYKEQTNSVVNKAADKISKALASHQDLQKLFYDILDDLQAERHRIAKESKTPDSEEFGRMRNKDFSPWSFSVLSINNEYTDQLIDTIQKYLKTFKCNSKEFEKTKFSTSMEVVLGRKTQMDFEILTSDKRSEWSMTYLDEDYKKVCQICSLSSKELPRDKYWVQNLIKNRESMEKLKKGSINDYKRIIMTEIVKHFETNYKAERKSDWVVATLRLEINGKLYGLSQYITWMNPDTKKDPIENMKHDTRVGILHQDVFLIKTTLEDIAKIFAQAVTCKTEVDLIELHNHMALFRLELEHAMPSDRGNSAICEMYERAIYLHHNFQLKYDQTKYITLEALTTNLKKFSENYPKMMQFEKINRGVDNAMCNFF